MLDGIKRIHFVGIGGIGMSALARLVLDKGIRVSGSDLVLNDSVKALQKAGARITIGHAAHCLADADVVVISTAIHGDNPEVSAARRKGCAVMHRSQLLSELTKGKVGIAVAGMHGKTTTTNLIYHVLKHAGFSPTLVLGGISRDVHTNALWGKGNYFIYEADESDGSLVHYHPAYSIITNIEEEHIGYYDGIDSILAVFRQFIDNHSRKDHIYCSIDCDNIRRLVKGHERHYKTYSVSRPAVIHAAQIKRIVPTACFDALHHERVLTGIHLNLAGMHNISNALPVIALAGDLGVSVDTIKAALASFPGTKRRMELIACENGVSVYDDYAHHPTEIRATLSALKKCSKGRLVVVFQPHRYSRIQHLFNQFVASFDQADAVLLTDIYGAGEEVIERLSSKELYRGITEAGVKQVEYVKDTKALIGRLTEQLLVDDTVVFMGAGDITKTAGEFAEVLRQGAVHGDELTGSRAVAMTKT
jgi:UDP-N-acetylmuramate--alanine ligase